MIVISVEMKKNKIPALVSYLLVFVASLPAFAVTDDSSEPSDSDRAKLKELILSTPESSEDRVYTTVSARDSYETVQDSGEDWKGSPDPESWNAGGLLGLAIFDGRAGFSFLGSVARKIVDRGFVPDINNQVFIEAELGPFFIEGENGVFVSAHLRWDFRKDDRWKFFALGGVGSQITGSGLGDAFRVYPRLGLGTMLSITPILSLRGEVSHEAVLVGPAFAF